MINVPIEVKDALRDGTYRKNYRMIVLNDDESEDFTIDNNNLVKESVNIDERMCSGDTLKFGLCEGSSLEFQYFLFDRGQYKNSETYMRNDLVHNNGITWRSKINNNTGHPLEEGSYWAEWEKPNITDRQLQLFCDIEYKGEGYVFTTIGQFQKYRLITINTDGVYRVFSETPYAYDYVYLLRNGQYTQYTPVVSDDGTEVLLEELQTGDKLEVEWSGTVYDTFLQSAENEIISKWYSIPMGFFTVKNCSRQASTGIIKVVAFNKLQSNYLDAKANNIILDMFDDDSQKISLYDLKRLLLSDYQIEPAEITEVQHPEFPFGVWVHCGSTMKFKLVSGSLPTGDMGPLNPLWSEVNSESINEFAVIFHEQWYEYNNLDPTQYYRIDSLFNLDEYEQSLYDYIENIVSHSSLNITTDTFMSNLVNNSYVSTPSGLGVRGWKGIFSIELIKPDDSSDYYSLIAYKNNLSDTLGTMKDLCQQIFTGYKGIRIWVPSDMGVKKTSDTQSFGGKTIVEFRGEDFTYEYYTDEYQHGTATWESFKEPNGEIITDYYLGLSDAVEALEIIGLTPADLVKVNINNIPDYTLRDLASAVYETQCQFGQLSRVTDLFSGVELNHSRLLPSDTLYPDNALYPDGAQESAFRSQYSKLWADEGNVHKWRYLIITYKGLDENQQEKDFTLQRTVNADGTDNYNCSDNWLFRNLVWTAEQIGEYADAMVAKMRDITWFPFEMWCAGLPYLETGDEIEIPLGEETYTSYILQRQLKGIQNLQDTYINGTLDIF